MLVNLRLLDKDQALRIEIELAVEPALPLPQDVGPVLFDHVPGLFLMRDSMGREEALHGADADWSTAPGQLRLGSRSREYPPVRISPLMK